MPPKNTSPITDQDILNFAKHKDDIRQAAEQAKTVIADAATLASKAIADAAAISVKVLSVKNADDHDLLIELKVGNQFIRDDIKNLSSGVTVQLDQLQKNKADKIDLDTLANEVHVVREKRMRDLETKTGNYMITLSLVMLGVAALFAIILTHVFKS